MNYATSTLLILLLLCTYQPLQAQIYQGNVDLRSQSEVNNFSFVEIDGKLTINGNDITDLSPLQTLRVVNILEIENCESLTVLNGLDSLQLVKERLEISRNEHLERITGLRQAQVTEELVIRINPKLKGVTGLNSLCGSMKEVIIERNDSLRHIDFMHCVEDVDGEILIAANWKLENINGLANLRHCKELTMRGLGQVSEFDSLHKLNVSRQIRIQGYNGYNMTGFPAQKEVDKILISNCGSLSGISAFSNLKEVDLLSIVDCPNLSSIAGFQNLNRVGKLELSEVGLRFFNEMGGLGGPACEIHFDNMPELLSMTALDTVTTLKALSLEYVNALIDLHNLSALDTIYGELDIERNGSLTSLSGLDNLVSIAPNHDDFALRIMDNPVLEEIDALGSLAGDFRGGMKIWNNPQLTSIAGLEHITNPTGSISIRNNPELVMCCHVRQWLLRRSVEMEENGPPCNVTSEAYPFGICDTTTEPIDTTGTGGTAKPFPLDTTQVAISPLFPNPSEGVFFFYYSNPNGEVFNVEVYTQMGKRISQELDLAPQDSYGKGSIDLSFLSPGRYYLRLVGPRESVARAFVVR